MRYRRVRTLDESVAAGDLATVELLLREGAAIEARDSLGDTPLRRAVNCNQPEVAALLLSRDADARSMGSKGLTPTSAARTKAMKRVFIY